MPKANPGQPDLRGAGRGLVGALRDDSRSAPISEQDGVMLDYGVPVTRDATRISRADPARPGA